MKIIHVLTDSNIGGAGHYLLAFLKAYDRNTFQIEVVLPVSSRLRPFVEAAEVNVIEVPHIQDQSFSVKGLGSLYRLFKEKKPDIVHTHASLSARIAAKLCGITVIYTRHYCLANNRLGFLNNLLNDRVIATAPEVTKGLLSAGVKPSQITTICNGVPPLRKFSPEEKEKTRARYKIPTDCSFVIAQVARLDPIKGHDHTLDAAKILSYHKEIVVLLVGDGDYETHLRKRIKDEALENVIMTGFVADVEEIFNITDLQINASFTETTCLALLEGMSLGIPAVATEGGGNPHVISHGERGLIVPCGDGAAIAKAVLAIKDDPALYRQMSEGALDGYNQEFRAENMARLVENLYREVLK